MKTSPQYLNVEITIAHVKESTFEKREESRAQMDEFARKFNFQNAKLKVIVEGEAFAKLNNFAQQDNFDVIANISSGPNVFLSCF